MLVPCTYGDLLIALHNRQTEEKELINSSFRGGKGKKKVTTGQAISMYCRLFKQQHELDNESELDLAAKMAGLGERQQTYKPLG